MRKLYFNRLLCIFAALALSAHDALGDRHEIIFPVANAFISDSPLKLGFAFDGEVGLALVGVPSEPTVRLFSFLIKERQVVDQVDLKPDFGSGIESVSIKVHNSTGLVLIHGVTSNQTQKILALASDPQGRLRRLWIITLPQGALTSTWGLSFKEDGSQIYLLYMQSLLRARVLDSESGSTLAAAAFQGSGISPISSFFGSISFNERLGRVVVMAGDSVYLFNQKSTALELDSTINASGLDVVDLTERASSHDGRFVVGSYAFRVAQKVKDSEYIFTSFDLGSKTAREVPVKSRFTTEENFATFHSPSGNLLIPLSITFRRPNANTLNIVRNTSRFAMILALTPDGSLMKTGVEIPEMSPGSNSPNIVGESSRIDVSASGTTGLLPTKNGRVFVFDTLTGEIVNDLLVEPNRDLEAVRLMESSGALLFGAGDRLVLFDVEIGPIIKSVKVKNNRTIITGANFLSGASVLINGVDVDGANRSPDDPGREIIIDRGKSDFPSGEAFTVVVINRDNKSSRPFRFER